MIGVNPAGVVQVRGVCFKAVEAAGVRDRGALPLVVGGPTLLQNRFFRVDACNRLEN